MLEDIIGRSVVAVPFMPGFNNTLVVFENLDMKAGGVGSEYCMDEELKANTFGPTDVMASIAPIRAE